MQAKQKRLAGFLLRAAFHCEMYSAGFAGFSAWCAGFSARFAVYSAGFAGFSTGPSLSSTALASLSASDMLGSMP